MSSKNTMTRDAMLFLPAKVVEGLLVIGCSSLYSHIFVEGAVSAFNLTNTTIQLLYLILAGWMANSATRYVGEEYRADEGRGLFSTVSTIYVGLCVLVAIGCCITAAVTQSPVYLGGALMFCTYTAFQVLNAALIQLGRVKASILWSLTSAVLKLAVAFALVGGKSNYPSPFPAIFANTIADGVATIGAVFALSLPVVVRLKYFSKPLLNRFLKYGVPLMGVSISVALLNQIDKYLRGVYPAVLRGWREGGKAAAKPLLDQGVRLYLLIAVPAVAGLTAVALPLSRFLFPAKYAAGAPVIAYTALAMLFMGLTEYANKAYELEQSTVHVLQNSAIAAVIKVVSSVILLKTLGFTGGALGSVVAFASYFIITCVRVRSRFLFRVAPISLVRIIVSALLCGAAAFACTLLPVGNLIRLGAAVVVGAGVYAVCIIVSGEGREEVQAVLRRLKR